ncbi:hypothetical protein MLD52_06725 [Puniceicoccaceae bacterium K14]|nr:hypothetical protein [Puniceicoccaceae bacterium K14]
MNLEQNCLKTQLKQRLSWFLFVFGITTTVGAADDIPSQLKDLIEMNDQLMSLVQEQQEQINNLRLRLDELDETDSQQAVEIMEIRDEVDLIDNLEPSAPPSNRIVISGEAGIEYFAGESDAEFSNEEFRIGESRIFLEAEVANNIYFSTTIELFRRESSNSDVEVGEVYVDVENLFGLDRLATARVGRFQIPFGQEYLNRYVFENPLVSHSVADIMGIDEGVEVFGSANDFSYTLAVMNGGKSSLRDFDSGKAYIARFGYNPGENLVFHASFMDTGDIAVVGDEATELWVSDTRFRSIGSEGTSEFDVKLAQIDGLYEWGGGSLKVALGEASYNDNDPLGGNQRDFDFYQIELQQNFQESVYGVVRFSELTVNDGYLLAGNGDPEIFLRSGVFTEELSRLSLGVGYMPFENVIAKIEYSYEDGEHTDGSTRENADQFSAELGVRF